MWAKASVVGVGGAAGVGIAVKIYNL